MTPSRGGRRWGGVRWEGGHFHQCDIYETRVSSLAWPAWFTISSWFRFPEHMYIDLRVGPILDAKGQLLFSFCCQEIDFFPLSAKSENSGLSFCENNSFLTILMKQTTRVYPRLSKGFASILCALTAVPPSGYFVALYRFHRHLRKHFNKLIVF